jgi:hypothetical protein
MDKISSVFDEITAVFSKERLTEEERQHQRYIIVLMKKGRKTSIYKPDRPKFTVGRSSQCDFQVKDPYFPRKAAEIILDPTPLLRLQNSSEESSQIQHIKPGVKVKFQGYNLVLMDEGDVIKNQHCINRTNDKKKLSISLLLASVFALTILVSKFYLLKGSPRASSEITTETTVPVKFLSVTEPAVANRVKASLDKSDETELSVLRKKGVRPSRNTIQMIKPGRKRSSQRVRRASATPSPTLALARSVIDKSFQKALLLAEAKISNGNLSGASLLINPYLPLLTAKQKKRIVDVLDPHAEDIFRKAYILKAFDREASDRMMSLLSGSGLELLPSTKKAHKFVSDPKN